MPAFLLDKNVSRRAIEGIVRVRHNQSLLPPQATALVLLHAAAQQRFHAYITPQNDHILRHLSAQDVTQTFLEEVEVLSVGRYARRWARRLREHGFTREDAIVLSLGSFGTNTSGTLLGVDAVVTFDLAFVNNYRAQEHHIRPRFRAMTRQLPLPYGQALLPHLLEPGQALASLP